MLILINRTGLQVADLIQNLRNSERSRRFVGPMKHGGQEDSSVFYAPPGKFSGRQPLVFILRRKWNQREKYTETRCMVVEGEYLKVGLNSPASHTNQRTDLLRRRREQNLNQDMLGSRDGSFLCDNLQSHEGLLSSERQRMVENDCECLDSEVNR